MIETFRLHALLRETVSSPYRCMVTRPTGAAIRVRIEQALADSPCITALLDFAEVELIDFSCADEVVAKLLVDRHPADTPYFVLLGLSDDQVEAVSHVLAHRGLAVATVAEAAARPAVIGCASADTRAAFGSVCADGPADEGALAARLGWARERAASALDALAALRLARPVDGALHPVPLP